MEKYNAENLYQQGLALAQRQLFAEAESYLQKCIELNPAHWAARNALGVVLRQTGRLAEAIDCLHILAAKCPGSPEAWYNLANALQDGGALSEACGAYQKSLAIQPQSANTWINLGKVLKDQARLPEAIESYQRALAIDANSFLAHSNLLLTMHLLHGAESEEVFSEHQRWARKFADPLTSSAVAHENDRDPERRLRIGYISPDFRNHPVGLLLEPIVCGHNQQHFEIALYSDVRRPDDVTERFRGSANLWRLTAGVSDEELARVVREDGVDILVDTTLHLAQNRMRVFARKPAPVQVNYLAYPATSGIAAEDYRITDYYLDPPGMTEAFHTEKLVRVPGSFYCYPRTENGPEIAPPPSENTGRIVFASLNNFSKATPQSLELWGRVLHAVPGSELHLVLRGGIHGSPEIPGWTEKAGIPAERLIIHERQSRGGYLAMYNSVDVCLDPLPVNGGTTTLDALYMGVPVVTLEGRSGLSRAGVSILTNMGLRELIARTPQEYVNIAVRLAEDVNRRRELRRTLRGRLLHSLITDARQTTGHLEFAYRRMWTRWTNGEEAAEINIPLAIDSQSV